MAEERRHHELSFSKWSALKVCPHFQSSERVTKEAKGGSDSHDNLEELIHARNTSSPCGSEALKDSKAAFALDFIDEKIGNSCVFIHSEEKVEVVSGLGFPAEGVFGYCDAWSIDEDGRLKVFDYKSGASTNFDDMPQVMGYALAICSQLRRDGVRFNENEIDCYVIYGSDYHTSYGMFTLDQLLENAVVVMDKVQNKAHCSCELNGHCKYCGGNMKCDKLREEIIGVNEGTLAEMPDAKLYSLMSVIKSVAEKKLDELKETARANGGFLDSGDIRYELRADKHGRMTGVDVNGLRLDLMERGVEVTPEVLIGSCSIAKGAFKELVKDDAKLHGVKVKELEEMYDKRSVFGKPSEKMVRVDVLR